MFVSYYLAALKSVTASGWRASIRKDLTRAIAIILVERGGKRNGWRQGRREE